MSIWLTDIVLDCSSIVRMAGVFAANLCVFAMWRFARLRGFMNQWFVHHPAQGLITTTVPSAAYLTIAFS